ncbi:MAG TPA: hypothetical protein VMX17_12720 [Candidatus Glassbacteria bacterium]|nr:hypothetical protein [Candidatus Glassbacteria bacterium]
MCDKEAFTPVSVWLSNNNLDPKLEKIVRGASQNEVYLKLEFLGNKHSLEANDKLIEWLKLTSELFYL